MIRVTLFAVLSALTFFAHGAFAQHSNHEVPSDAKPMGEQNHSPAAMGPGDCNANQTWDYSMGSCRQLAMAGMPMSMWMIHGNAFLVQSFQEGPRGRNRVAAPNMVMAEAGRSVGSKHYIDANLMLTAERWTFPK